MYFHLMSSIVPDFPVKLQNTIKITNGIKQNCFLDIKYTAARITESVLYQMIKFSDATKVKFVT